MIAYVGLENKYMTSSQLCHTKMHAHVHICTYVYTHTTNSSNNSSTHRESSWVPGSCSSGRTLRLFDRSHRTDLENSQKLENEELFIMEF